MKKHIEKISEINNYNDSLFLEIFSFRKKKEESGFIYEDEEIVIDGSHRLLFKNADNSIEKPLPNYGAWTNIKWENDNFNWLLDSNFKTKSALIEGSGNSRKIEQFQNCIWQGGNFRGGQFIRGEFNDGTFLGKFGPGAKWNANPYSFIDGTTLEKETILGLPNITNLSKSSFKFNVISVVPGNDILINLENGISHKISVLKRLDDKNSIFSYDVTNGVTKEKARVNIRWSQLRGQNKTEFLQNTMFVTNSIPRIFTESIFFNLPFESPIKNVVIDTNINFETPQWSDKEQSPAELSKQQVEFELSNLDFLGIPKITRKGETEESMSRIYFNFPTSTDKKAFESIVDAIQKGWINAYIKKLNSAISNNVITEIPSQFPYLSNLLNLGAQAVNENLKNIDKDTQNAMLGLENFLRYFVDLMVRRYRKTGKEKGLYDVKDTKGQQIIKNRLRELILGKESSKEKETKQQQKKTQTKLSKPGRRLTFESKKSCKKGISNIIKNILSENLKHF